MKTFEGPKNGPEVFDMPAGFEHPETFEMIRQVAFASHHGVRPSDDIVTSLNQLIKKWPKGVVVDPWILARAIEFAP